MFSELFPTCFEIWTWSLVYTSCRWHDTSSLSFNAIGCLSPTLQRSIIQIRFSTHGLINYVNPPNLLAPIDFCYSWQIFGLGGLNIQKRESLVISPWFPACKSVPDVFLNVLKCQLESWFVHSVGCKTYWFHVSPELGPCDLLHVLDLGTVNYQGIHWRWQTDVLGSLWPRFFVYLSESINGRWVNHIIPPVPVKQSWRIWINDHFESTKI